MVEEMTVTETIKKEVRLRFITLVFKNDLHPQDAAEKMGMPYALFLAARETDPGLAMCWEGIEERRKQKSKGGPKSVLEFAEAYINDMFVRGKLHEKVVSMAENADIDTPEGRKTVMWMVQYGILRDSMPRFTAATIEHRQAHVDKHASLTTNELLAMLEEKAGTAIRLNLEKEFANKQRLELGRDQKVSDAEFRHVQGRDHSGD